MVVFRTSINHFTCIYMNTCVSNCVSSDDGEYTMYIKYAFCKNIEVMAREDALFLEISDMVMGRSKLGLITNSVHKGHILLS